MEAWWMGFSFELNTHHSWYLLWRQKQALFLTWKRASDPRPPTVYHHFFETMCPTAFLAPTLTAKTCFICTQAQNAFFLAQLAVQDNWANGQKSFPGHVPGPKKRTKMVPKSGPFQKEFFCSAAKKSPKNWTGPWLSLNMVNGNTFSKWQTPLRNAKCSFQGANPTPPSPIQPCGNRRPERRSNRNVYCGGPLIWWWKNCTSKTPKFELHLFVKVHCASAPCQSIADHNAILEWQLKLILQCSNGKQEGAIPQL